MELLSLREHHARTLLIHYRWDVEKLLAVLVEKGKESLFSEAGVTVSDDAGPMLPLLSMVMCDICMEEIAGDKATKMDCGHCFCNDCKYPDSFSGLLLSIFHIFLVTLWVVGVYFLLSHIILIVWHQSLNYYRPWRQCDKWFLFLFLMLFYLWCFCLTFLLSGNFFCISECHFLN